MMQKQFRRQRHILFFLLILFILAGTALVLFFALKVDPVAEVLKNDQIIKILAVLENDGSAVSTVILAYYPISHRGAFIDILGNTGAIYSSLGRVDRIDAVYKEKGISAYRSEIEKLVGMSIPFSLAISLDDFSVLTDLLGGLRVFVPYPVDDIVDDARYLLPSGSVNLDGDKIRTYITYKNTEENSVDQQDRLQNALIAFLAALNKNRNDVFKKKIFPLYASRMRTNMTRKDDLYRLLEELSMIDTERLFPQTITGSLRQVDGKQLLFPYYDGQLIKDVCKQTVSALISEINVEYSRIYVLEIQNGTTTQGLARNTAALLQSVGYDVLTTNNADRSDYDATFIIDHIGNIDIAKSLGEFIRCTNIVTAEVKKDDTVLDADSLVDFTIVLGKDFDGRYVR